MTTQPPYGSIEIVKVDTSPEFQKNVLILKKKYRNISKDIRSTITQIQQGQFLGDQVSGTGFAVYKVRVRNRDIKKGKSAGYRIIYQVESQSSVVLLRIYSKSDTDDLSRQEILDVINGLDRTNESEKDTNLS